jgi:hypothetical protein
MWRTGLMSYSVHFGIDLDAIRVDERSEIQRTMEQVAEAISTVPDSSPFWASMSDSLLQIDVVGWRVVYRIDAIRREVRVVEVTRIR